MPDITMYGKMSKEDLAIELADVCNTLQSRIRELGGLVQDYNNDYYVAYFRAPGNSVSAKEREAEYSCLTLINERAVLDAEINALTVAKECIETILTYAP
jgi:hypothetical protein